MGKSGNEGNTTTEAKPGYKDTDAVKWIAEMVEILSRWLSEKKKRSESEEGRLELLNVSEEKRMSKITIWGRSHRTTYSLQTKSTPLSVFRRPMS